MELCYYPHLITPRFLYLGKLFGKGLEDIAEENSDLIKEVRGRGSMWGVEYYKEDNSKLSMMSIIKEGVLLNYCGNKEDTLIIMPPLIVKKEEIEEIIIRISRGILNLKKIK